LSQLFAEDRTQQLLIRDGIIDYIDFTLQFDEFFAPPHSISLFARPLKSFCQDTALLHHNRSQRLQWVYVILSHVVSHGHPARRPKGDRDGEVLEKI
jgi:hypothetical protein